ncbi:MAG TPA: hypothetical protein VJV78_35835 [Polyangiales bacterium]|nr:hypothetical protein [Polyangiales bacterium]
MPDVAGSPAAKPPAGGAGVAGARAPTMTGSAGSTTPSGAAGSGTPPPTGEICARWKADRVNLTEGAWNGDAAACNAGDMTPEARATALRLHTLYRFMAGLDPVMMTDENNRKAQGCALLMTANGSITHTPPSTWKCYTMELGQLSGIV